MISLGAMRRNQVFGRGQKNIGLHRGNTDGAGAMISTKKKWRGKDFFKGKDDGANTSHQEESDSEMGNFEPRKKSRPLHFFLRIKWQPRLFLLKKFRLLIFF